MGCLGVIMVRVLCAVAEGSVAPRPRWLVCSRHCRWLPVEKRDAPAPTSWLGMGQVPPPHSESTNGNQEPPPNRPPESLPPAGRAGGLALGKQDVLGLGLRCILCSPWAPVARAGLEASLVPTAPFK